MLFKMPNEKLSLEHRTRLGKRLLCLPNRGEAQWLERLVASRH